MKTCLKDFTWLRDKTGERITKLLTQVCCTPVLRSWSRHRTFVSKSQMDSRLPRTHPRAQHHGLWLCTSHACSAALTEGRREPRVRVGTEVDLDKWKKVPNQNNTDRQHWHHICLLCHGLVLIWGMFYSGSRLEGKRNWLKKTFMTVWLDRRQKNVRDIVNKYITAHNKG